MRSLGLTPNRLTNSWVPFLVAATECLNEGGRLAFVVPAELLQVSYAAQLRSFLTDRFERINIVTCNDLFFEGAEQEVVLLLADGAFRNPSERNVCRVAVTEIEQVSDLRETSPATLVSQSESKDVRHDSEKWLKYFLSNREIGLMRNLRDDASVTQLEDHAEVDVGVVTGKNEFFLLNEEQVDTLRVRKFVKPVVGRSAHIRGARFMSEDWAELVTSGQRVFLLDIGLVTRARLPEPFREYVESAERNGFHRGYKCSIRSPWYAVPSVWEPDAFLFRQIYDFPRLVVNQAGATSTDTIHRVRCKGRPERLAANMYTSLTAASAEIEGRSYGGGVLELEPTEAERLLVPKKLSGALALGECDRLVRGGRLTDVLKENDQLILRAQIGLSRGDCKLLLGVWEKMRDRRMSRRRSKSSPNDGS
jgi:adenine-specific DNA methylase